MSALKRTQMHPLLVLFKDFALKKGIADDAYIVGGAVRDMLSGVETKDIDLAVAGDALEISKEFAHYSGSSFVLLDSAFGIARVVKDGVFLDISAMRGHSITADLADRDMTINAMALPLREWGSESPHVIDPFGGGKDLGAGIIRMVSERNIVNDPLRIIRIYRFSAVLRASIEKNTRQAVNKYNVLLKDVAVERIAEELRHIMSLGNSHEIMNSMEDDGIVRVLFPEFLSSPGNSMKQGIPFYGQCEGILADPAPYFPFASEHILAFFEHTERRICLKLAALFSGEARVMGAVSRLKMSNKEAEFISFITSGHKNILSMAAAGSGETGIIRFLKVARDNVYPAVVLAAVGAGGWILPFLNDMLSLYLKEVMPRMSLIRMITGDDLITEFGLTPSPQFKLILSELEDNILEGKINTKEDGLEAAREIISRFSRSAGPRQNP
ncbi:MAG: hypothetical protein HQL09_06225 [Nitrospirae bacterium]|nr:hypothetical protein [Nitrospirota bacterium]